MPLEGGEEGVELLLLGGVEGGQGEDCQPAQGEQSEGVGQGAQQGAAVQHQGELQGVQGVLDEKEGLEVGGEAVVAVGGLEQHGRDLGGGRVSGGTGWGVKLGCMKATRKAYTKII